MRNIVLNKSLKDNSRVIFSTVCSYLITSVLFYLSYNISFYFYLVAIPISLLSIYFTKVTINQISSSINRFSNDEKYFRDGEHKLSFKNNKKTQYILNTYKGKRHGSYEEFYENGQLKYKSQYENGIQFGETLSYYKNGNLFRKFNLIDNEYDGKVEEYYNSSERKLKFTVLDDLYTFYNELQNIIYEIQVSDYGGFKGVWKNFRNNGSLEYELDFESSELTDGEVIKRFYSEGEDIISIQKFSYDAVRGIHANFTNQYAGQRLESKYITKGSTIKGPPGVGNGFQVKNKNIESLDEIIILEFKNLISISNN